MTMWRKRRIPAMLTLYEVAKVFRCSRRNVIRYLRAGRLQAYQLGAKGSEWRVPVESVMAFLEKNHVGTAWIARWRREREQQDAEHEQAA
jgi:excisionase family DNA binding protein